jgi:hypothetical protein
MGDIVNGESVVKVVVESAGLGGLVDFRARRNPMSGLMRTITACLWGSRLGGGITSSSVGHREYGGWRWMRRAVATDFTCTPNGSTPGSTGTLAVFLEDDPDHFRLLGKVPTGAIAKSGIWIPEMKRYYAAVPKHLVQLIPTTKYGIKDWITEEAHMMVFEEIP